MKIIEYFDSEARKQRHTEELENKAEEIYQVCEHDSQLWLTFGGNLVCPTSMLNNEPVVAVNMMRKMFVERNSRGL